MGFCDKTEKRLCVTHSAAALITGAALTDAEFPVPAAMTMQPSHSQYPHTGGLPEQPLLCSQADRTWVMLPVSLATHSLSGAFVPWGGFSATHCATLPEGLTLRYSTGLVTLNLSIVVMMIAGVVRKKRRIKRTTLITRQRIHQMKPRMERCSLG